MHTAYIHRAKRTPMGLFMGKLANYRAPQLASSCIAALKAEQLAAGLPFAPEQVFLGQVLQAAVGQAPARQAALLAGLDHSIPCTTINRVCGSGLEAVIQAAKSIQLGETAQAIAGGMESMSQTPFALEQMRRGHKYGSTSMTDLLQFDGLTDAYSKESMGACTEACLKDWPLAPTIEQSREQQDQFARQSFERALKAQEQGWFNSELAPLQELTLDEGPSKFQPAKMSQLRPAFTAQGSMTAANSSGLSDGASALLLSRQREGASFEILSWGHAAIAPRDFALAPIKAAQIALERAKLKPEQIDLFEINEAFAAVALHFIKGLNLTDQVVNIQGGAIALGHPLGNSGSRILTTLLHAMTRCQSTYGLASLCIGGGEGIALIVKKISN